jgi:hypothetical protein
MDQGAQFEALSEGRLIRLGHTSRALLLQEEEIVRCRLIGAVLLQHLLACKLCLIRPGVPLGVRLVLPICFHPVFRVLPVILGSWQLPTAP